MVLDKYVAKLEFDLGLAYSESEDLQSMFGCSLVERAQWIQVCLFSETFLERISYTWL